MACFDQGLGNEATLVCLGSKGNQDRPARGCNPQEDFKVTRHSILSHPFSPSPAFIYAPTTC